MWASQQLISLSFVCLIDVCCVCRNMAYEAGSEVEAQFEDGEWYRAQVMSIYRKPPHLPERCPSEDAERFKGLSDKRWRASVVWVYIILSIHLSICLFIYLFFYLTICLSRCVFDSGQEDGHEGYVLANEIPETTQKPCVCVFVCVCVCGNVIPTSWRDAPHESSTM